MIASTSGLVRSTACSFSETSRNRPGRGELGSGSNVCRASQRENEPRIESGFIPRGRARLGTRPYLTGALGGEDCTPSYYNNEGKPNDRLRQSMPYGDGPIAFFALLKAWREEGKFEGLVLD